MIEERKLLTCISGGGNGLSVFPTGVHYDIPVVDGDGMGRAYPTMYQGKIPRTFLGYCRG